MSISPSRIVIIGAGIMGSSLAYYLARRGVAVTVVEREEVAGGATGLSAGAYRSQFPWREETAIALRSKELRNAFEVDEDVDLMYRHVGFVLAASDDASEADLRGRRGFQNDLGMNSRLLDGTELSTLLPGLHTDDIRFAVFTPDDGWAPPAQVTRIVMAKARGLGVELVSGTVVDIRVSDGAATGVVLFDGTVIEGDAVVDAAGLWAGEVAAKVGLDLPITSNRQHQFFSGAVSGFDPETVPNFTDPGLGLYMRGQGSTIMLSVADAAEAGRLDTAITEPLRAAARERAEHRWPAVAATGVPSGFVGVYEATPDRRGLVGAHPDLPGFFYVGGFSGHGFMHGLAVGEAMSGFVLDGRWGDLDLSVLSVSRFAETDITAAFASGTTMGGERA